MPKLGSINYRILSHVPLEEVREACAFVKGMGYGREVKLKYSGAVPFAKVNYCPPEVMQVLTEELHHDTRYFRRQGKKVVFERETIWRVILYLGCSTLKYLKSKPNAQKEIQALITAEERETWKDLQAKEGLLIFADYLEEQGDPRAQFIRERL